MNITPEYSRERPVQPLLITLIKNLQTLFPDFSFKPNHSPKEAEWGNSEIYAVGCTSGDVIRVYLGLVGVLLGRLSN